MILPSANSVRGTPSRAALQIVAEVASPVVAALTVAGSEGNSHPGVEVAVAGDGAARLLRSYGELSFLVVSGAPGVSVTLPRIGATSPVLAVTPTPRQAGGAASPPVRVVAFALPPALAALPLQHIDVRPLTATLPLAATLPVAVTLPMVAPLVILAPLVSDMYYSTDDGTLTSRPSDEQSSGGLSDVFPRYAEV